MGRRMPRRHALAIACAVAGALAIPSTGAAALRATGLTVATRAAYDQVVVTFAGGRLTGLERQVEATDVAPGDGHSVVRVTGRRIAARPAIATGAGVTARLAGGPGSVRVVMTTPPGRSKFVQYRVDGSRTHLVVRLWRARVAPAARVLSDGCLRLTAWSGRRGGSARGLELRPLFEHGLVLSARRAGAGGTALAERPLTAHQGVFLPDFSGYATPGRWSGRLRAAPGAAVVPVMLEAWSTSAKDGSLQCLVQTPVNLRR
jgi:hypothetical protein